MCNPSLAALELIELLNFLEYYNKNIYIRYQGYINIHYFDKVNLIVNSEEAIEDIDVPMIMKKGEM